MGSISPVSDLIGQDPSTSGPQVSKNDFLRLLMAQVNNQDPLEPMDNAQFVSQLTQFSSLEQLLMIREALERISPPQDELALPPQTGSPAPPLDQGSGSEPGGTGGAPGSGPSVAPGGNEGAPEP